MPQSWTMAWHKLRREWRAGEHLVLLLSLLVAVTSLTAVSFFTSRVDRAMAARANEILASDLRVRSNRPMPENYLQQAHALTLRSAEVQTFPSVVVRDDLSSISSIVAVSENYPLRGELKVSDQLNGVQQSTRDIPRPGEIWVDPRLLVRLNTQVGEPLQLGNTALRVTRVLEARPDQGSQFVNLAPTVLMRLEDLEATGLRGPGSRVQYALLFAGATDRVQAFSDWLTPQLQAGERKQEVSDASRQVSSSMERASRFLNLTSLTSVLLSGIAVAMAARRYAARHLDRVALMKALGASQSLVLNISVIELLLLGLLAGIVGSALGYVAQQGLSVLARDLLSGDLPTPSLTPLWLGIITPVIVLAGFALPPLMQLRRVPPARVLRHNDAPPPLRYLTVYGVALAALLVLLWLLVRDLRLITYVVAGTAAVLLVLAVVGWLLVRSLNGLRRSVGVSWRYGVANIARRGRESVAQLVAFGLGLMVLLLLLVVRNDLLRDWQTSLPVDAPNQFLINIAPDQTQALSEFFTTRGIAKPTLVPMLRARLQSINDTPISAWRSRDGRGREFLDREANLSWTSELQDGNKIIAGTWWRDGDGGGARVSVERGFAESLGLKLGDRVTYDVSGTPISATVSSIREVRWDSFKPNFFMVFSPGVLDQVVGTYITSVHLDATQRGIMGEFYRRFPEVTAIDIDALLNQVRGVMDNAALAIQYVFVFSLLAGVSVLLAAVQSTRDERRHESAMLRTLGASRRVVLQGVAAEFIVLGLLAGLLGALGASAIGYVLATQVFNLKYTLDFTVWWIGVVSGVLLVGLTGIAVTRSVVNSPPIMTLREH